MRVPLAAEQRRLIRELNLRHFGESTSELKVRRIYDLVALGLEWDFAD